MNHAPTGSFLRRDQPRQVGPAPSPFKAAIAAHANKPAGVVVLAPSMWAQTYPDRQHDEARVGLRVYSETDAQQARAAAAQKAWKLHPQPEDEDVRLAAYNGVLMGLIVARATCDPDDATIPFFGSHDGAVADIVPLALTPRGIEFLFEEIEVLLTEQATSPEASDEDLAWLSSALATGEAWNALPFETARRVRRLLGRCIDDMQSAR